MKYSDVETNRDVLLKLIDFLYHQVFSSGGDGDATWVSKYYFVKEIKKLVEEYNNALDCPWEIKYEEGGDLLWGENQEWIIISNNMILADPETYHESLVVY